MVQPQTQPALYLGNNPYPAAVVPSGLVLQITNAAGATVYSVDIAGRKAGVYQTLGAIVSSSTIQPNNDAATVNPSGAVTGIILAAGTYDGQIYEIVNLSANTVTFAASGTSNVADGTSAVIAANRMVRFKWIGGLTNLWFRTG